MLPGIDEEEAQLRLTLSPPGGGGGGGGAAAAVAAAAAAAAAARGAQQQQLHHERPRSSDASSEETKKARKLRSSTASSSSTIDQAAAAPAAATTTKQDQKSSSGSGGKEERIVPAYTWAGERRAVVRSLEALESAGIDKVAGDVVCKRCDGAQTVEVGVAPAFAAVSGYFVSHRDTMHDRAPKCWTSPRLLDCSLCLQTDCVKPIIHAKKRHINWLFLLLTQTLGLCTLDQLKYFCKHTRRHRTGAKDRVLYLTYVGLLKQLNPAGPYE